MLLIRTYGKPKLTQHIKAHKTYKQTIKWTKSEEPKLEPLPQHKNFLELDLTVPLSQSTKKPSG